MPISNYPNGFQNGITLRGIPIQVMHPGQVYFVNNSTAIPQGGLGGSDGNSGTYQKPFSTIDYAIGRCTAGRGDIIFVMPGHIENIDAASGIALDVAGVAVIGLGTGSLRPKLNTTVTTATFAMNAANCAIKNILFTNVVSTVSPIVVSAGYCTIEGCEMRDVGGSMVDGILTTAGATGLKILNHTHTGTASAGTNAAIAITGGAYIEITADFIYGNFAVAAIDIRTTRTILVSIHDIKFVQTVNSANMIIKDTITASDGQIGPNINARLKDNAANITEAFTGATFHYMQPINIVNAAGESSMQTNITASTDA